MMRILAALYFTTTVTMLAQSSWTSEPTGYRRLPFGSSQAAATMMLSNLNRCTSDQGGGILTCTDTQDSFAIGHTFVKERLLFPGDAFAAVTLDFSADHYIFIRSVFIEKYGKPSNRTVEPFTTKGGGTFENERLEWVGTKAVVSLERFSGTIDKSVAMLTTTSFLRDRAAQEKEERRQAVASF